MFEWWTPWNKILKLWEEYPKADPTEKRIDGEELLLILNKAVTKSQATLFQFMTANHDGKQLLYIRAAGPSLVKDEIMFLVGPNGDFY